MILTEPGVGYRWVADAADVGQALASPAHGPTTARPTSGSGNGVLKRVLVGRAVASDRLEHTLLPKILALPVFSSDALSSVAYATEEILRVLLVASVGTVASRRCRSRSRIAALLIIVVSSYRQTVGRIRAAAAPTS